VGRRLQHRRDPVGGRRPGGRGILLPPAIAAVLMSASTVIVAINAQLLRRAKV
jgi:cation transport ATPase